MAPSPASTFTNNVFLLWRHLSNCPLGVVFFTSPMGAGSYGSLARYTELRRIRRVGDYTLVAASGEYSDFQYVMDLLHELV